MKETIKKDNIGLEIDTQRTQKVYINNLVNNLGEYKKLTNILQSSTIEIFLSFSLSFIIIYFISAIYQNKLSDAIELYNIWENYKNTLSGFTISFYSNTIHFFNSTLISLLEITHFENELFNTIKETFLTIEKGLKIEPRTLSTIENYLILLTIFIFIVLNILNIIQAVEQTKLTNSRIINYYKPKVFIVFYFLGLLDTNKLYIKRIKQLRTQANFKDKTILEQLNNIFFLKKWEKYDIKEINKVFLFFYSYTTLELIEIKQDETTKNKRGRPIR